MSFIFSRGTQITRPLLFRILVWFRYVDDRYLLVVCKYSLSWKYWNNRFIFLILIFVSILSIYSALTFLLYSSLKNYGHKLGMYFALPSAWVIIEIIRSHLFTGFPWLISGTMIGESLIDGFTPIIGAQGNTFFIILLASIIYKIVDCVNKKYIPCPNLLF